MWNLLNADGPFPSDVKRPAESARTGSSVLSLVNGNDDETVLGWQERALCAQTGGVLP